jgi:hypothetical protein
LETLAKLVEKWKSEGVRHLGVWSSTGRVDGFAHYQILEFDDVSKVREVARDFSRATGKYIEKLSFDIGHSSPEIEDLWKSS